MYLIQNDNVLTPDFDFDKTINVKDKNGDGKPKFWKIDGKKDSSE